MATKSHTRSLAEALKSAQKLETSLKEIDLRTLRGNSDLLLPVKAARESAASATTAITNALNADRPALRKVS